MNFSKEVITIFDELAKRFGIAIDWTQQNILPYLQQLGARVIAYEIWTSVVWIAIFLFPGLFLGVKAKKWIPAAFDEDIDAGCLLVAGYIIFFAIAIWVIITQVFDITQAITLPEKTLYEFYKSVK